MSQSLISMAYIAAAILFILSLSGLSNQETSRRGNYYGMVGMAIAGFTYKVRCLFLGAGGGSVAILKSKDRSELEAAQRAIEEGKRAFEASGKKL